LFIETNYGDITLYTSQTNQVAYRACRVRCDGRDALAV